MSDIRVARKVKDSLTFSITEAEATKTRTEPDVCLPKRDVPYSDGVKWWIAWKSEGPITKINFRVNKWLPRTFKITSGSNFQCLPECRYDKHFHYRDGKVTFTCEVEFDVPVPFVPSAPRLFEYCDHVPTDCELIMGSERVSVHKSLLSLLSPVFHAMFLHDTIEARSSKVKIVDFDPKTVKSAVDFCYGRVSEAMTVENCVDILRFADKYDMKAISAQMETIPQSSLSTENFPIILNYAYEYSKDDLFDRCVIFFKLNVKTIKTTENFSKLHPAIVVRLLKAVFAFLKSDFEVFLFAYHNQMQFVTIYLEQSLFNTLYLTEVCQVFKYAWDNDRDELKERCVTFILNNLIEVMKRDEFYSLPTKAVLLVWTREYELKYSKR